MNELLIAAMGGVVLIVMCGVSYLLDVIAGDVPARAIRAKQKVPRKGAASRGTVGRKVHRATYEYIEIVPQIDPRVKGLRVERVRRYMR